MLKIRSLWLDYQEITQERHTHFLTSEKPVFSWKVDADRPANRQKAVSIKVTCDDGGVVCELWESGWLETDEQQLQYAGKALMTCHNTIHVEIQIKDIYGETASLSEYLLNALIDWTAPWIASPVERPRTTALYFSRRFTVDTVSKVQKADLFVCGVGYQQVLLNGMTVTDGERPLDPPVTDYSKECHYVFIPNVETYLEEENGLGITVGLGWRENDVIVNTAKGNHDRIPFWGDPMLTAMLVLYYEDGTQKRIVTDSSWLCGTGPITYNDVFNGIIYDSRLENPLWGTADYKDDKAAPAKLADGPGGKLVPMKIPPVQDCETLEAKCQWPFGNACILDFGQNISGVVELMIPQEIPEGTVVTIRYAEELDENGDLYMAPLRSAKATDTYIVGKTSRELFFRPTMTYHGFRYIAIEGLGNVINDDYVLAYWFHNDLDKKSFFTCGNPLVNQIHANALATERGNTHGLLTDCPQRNERMGWMNDATVRFEAFPYAFEADGIFRKIIRDLQDEQGADGAITCTAPYIFGGRPADPVCSSFLIAGKQAYMHYGDKEIIAEAYDSFKGWTDCLLAHSKDYIVDYSYYGDWAAPAYACDNPDGARSGVTPGVFMSTGYSFYNHRTIAEFARILGRKDDEKTYSERADAIAKAMLDKWYDPAANRFATGSMACQIFPIWLGIYPKDGIAAAVKGVRDELVANDFRFTTGNLCTRYLFEILTEYGYVDDAWTLITKETYPSYGFMIQQEATTVWERFELKKNPGMNSHNHPMYGAVYHWFYAHLAGIQVTGPACNTVEINPYYPSKLLSVHCQMDTVKGPVTVRWFKRYDKLNLHVTVPFGMLAKVHFNGQVIPCGSGFHAFAM